MKFTSLTEDVKNISKLPDRPSLEAGYTSDDVKALFDKAGESIKNYINTILIEELASMTENFSGADRVGSGVIDTLPGDTVQEKLKSVASQIKDLANSTLPDGSVSPEKFSPEISDFLTSASIRCVKFFETGTHTFTVQRDGTYKITAVGGGAGGGLNPAAFNHSLGGGSAASAILWVDLKKNDILTLNIGKGGKGLYKTEEGNAVNGTNGENTTVMLGSDTLLSAEGGILSLMSVAKAEGGDLNYSGEFGKAGRIYGSSTHTLIHTMGGDSILGRGCCYEDDVAGIGGGGFCGKNLGIGVYENGTDGGNGAVIIEYMK